MQELSVSGHESKSLTQTAMHGSGDGADKHTSHIDFGNCSLVEIHNLSNHSNLTSMHFHQINQTLPTLLLDGAHNNTEHHVVAAGETLSEIAAEHLGTASAPEIYNMVNQIAELNHLDSLDQIDQGQFLVFPELTNFGPVTAVSAIAAAPAEVNSAGSVSSETSVSQPQSSTEESAVSDFLSGLGTVVSEIGQGCVDQVTEHPIECLAAAAATVGTACLAAAAAPLIATGLATAGIVTTGAEVLAVMGVIGAANTTHEFLSNAGDWYEAAQVVANSDDHNSGELATAQNELHEVSNFVVNEASGYLGGLHMPHFTPTHNGLRNIENEDDKKDDADQERTARKMSASTSLAASAVDLS